MISYMFDIKKKTHLLLFSLNSVMEMEATKGFD